MSVPVWLFLAVVLVLVLALGAVVVQRDRARSALSTLSTLTDPWQPPLHLRPSKALPPVEGGWGFWENAAAGVSPEILAVVLNTGEERTAAAEAAGEAVRVDFLPNDTEATVAERYGAHVAHLVWAATGGSTHRPVIVYPRAGGSV